MTSATAGAAGTTTVHQRQVMKTTTLQVVLFVGVLLTQMNQALDYKSGGTQSNQPRYKVEPSHYLDFPVTKKDFSNWGTLGSAVILKSHVVLNPESKDKKGIIYSKHQNPLVRDWLLDVELDIGNDKQTVRGGTGLGIFYLKSIDQVSHQESIFGYTNRFEGLGIYINSIMKSETRGANKEILNAVQGYSNDGSRAINVFTEKKHLCFKHLRNLPEGQTLKLRIMYDFPLVTVQVYDIYTQSFELCFSFETDLSFPGYFLFSGSSGVHNPDHTYIKSIKLYDSMTVATNDHFQDARRIKAEGEQDVANRIKEGAKDLFENKSLKDAHLKKSSDERNLTELYLMIPQQHNHVQHRLNELVTDFESGNALYFETMKGLPSKLDYNALKEKLFNFKLLLDNFNTQIEKESKSLTDYEKLLKQIKYSSNLQKGLSQREVNNHQTQKLKSDLLQIDSGLQAMATQFQDYQQALQTLSAKIKQEAGFTEKLESQRKKFAKEQSEKIDYDMREIDDFFNQMELSVVTTGAGLSTLLVRAGMIMVIAFSVLLWFKMNKYETKNE